MVKDLVLVGLSHHTAPLELREKLAVDGDARTELLKAWSADAAGEGVVISTCNRVELYATTDDAPTAERKARALLESKLNDGERERLGEALYVHDGESAIRHLFRVASSLDSMVVGEPQILGQVKEAYDAARSAGTLGSLLGRCFSRSFAVAKRVRTETGIAEGTVSVSSIASQLAKKIFGELAGRRVLLLGAGEMGEAAARSLANTGAVLRVVNRSPEKAHRVAAECGGEPRGYEQLASELVEADVVISSTSSDRYVLTTKLMKDVLRGRRHRPIFLIDIAVPRDVDPRVGEMESVFLFDVDDLQEVAQENLAQRRHAAMTAERIVDIEVAEIEAWRRTLDLTPTIVALRERFAEVVHGEIERSAKKLGLDDKDRRALERMGDAMVKKLLHPPLATLKKTAGGPENATLIAATRSLFDLEHPKKTEESAAGASDLVPDEG
jgi:glutamyl-tRNA reductase